MEHFGSELAFDLPATGVNFESFPAFPLSVLNNISHTGVSSSSDDSAGEMAAVASKSVTENFLRVLSEKIGRGLSAGVIGGVGGNAVDKFALIRNQVILNGTGNGAIGSSSHILNITQDFPNEDWIRQAEYDKFMNEIWIGIVLTLIVISMVFCICSCFLYHQFRQWKNNYHRNLQQNNDIESVKLSIDDDDLPSYTLVSGLPSYDAALEQLQKSSAGSNACLLMYPSVFKIFTTNEKQDTLGSPTSSHNHQQQHEAVIAIVPSYQEAVGSSTTQGEITKDEAPSYKEALLANSSSNS